MRVGFPEPGQFLPHDSGDPALQVGLEGGADGLMPTAQRRGHVRGDFPGGHPVEVERFLPGCGDLPGVVVPFLRKAIEDPVAALQGGLRIVDGIVQARRLGKAGEKGTLGKGKVPEGFAKVEPGRLPASLAMVAVIKPVEVGGEDLLLGPAVLKMAGGQAFADLGENVALGWGGTDLHQLLGDGGGSRNNPAIVKEIARGPCGGKVVHAVVGEEALVLRDQGGVEKGGRDVFWGDRLMTEEVCSRGIIEHHPAAVEDPRRAFRIRLQGGREFEAEGKEAPGNQSQGGRQKAVASFSSGLPDSCP